MKYLFLDTETTGIEEQDRLCQVSYLAYTEESNGLKFQKTEYFKPPLPISIEAMATTHITNRMVESAPAFKDSPMFHRIKEYLADGFILVAHNAKFDIAMLKKEGIEVPSHICTMKVARYLDDEGKLGRTTLQYLRYFYDVEVDGKAHDAEGDVAVLFAVFDKLSKTLFSRTNSSPQEVVERMIEISASPSLLRKMPFGKHKGLPMSQVPQDYLDWLSRQPDLDEDMKYTLKSLPKPSDVF